MYSANDSHGFELLQRRRLYFPNKELISPTLTHFHGDQYIQNHQMRHRMKCFYHPPINHTSLLMVIFGNQLKSR